jgi:hypothetical protein
MEVTLKIVPRPSSSSFTMLADFDREALRESKTVRVRASLWTKTRVETSMQVGNSRYGINLAVEGFKTHAESDMNYFSGTRTTHNYFKLLKSQNFDRYKEYVIAVVTKAMKENIRMELDTLTIELEQPSFISL